MKDLYIIIIRKKFKSLCIDNEIIFEIYVNIIFNEEIVKEVFFKRRKDCKRKVLYDLRVVKVREEL